MFVRSIDPRTGTLVKETPSSRPEDVHSALVRARSAQVEWAARSKGERIGIMRRAEELFNQEKESIVDLIQAEGGFPRKDAASGIVSALRGFAHYIHEYEMMKVKEYPLDPAIWVETEAHVEFVPHGVVGHIGIWNYPFWQTMISAIPALLVGNAIVFKPSELTTLTGLKIGEIWHNAGVPQDVFIPLVGGSEIGKEMVKNDFDAIVFTGGIETGLDILHNGGVKPMILELSGNDPAIVCADADIEQAARGVAQGTFSRGGQVCIRIKRVYVHRSVADAFIKRLLEIVNNIDVRQVVGPLIREQAREKVDRQVRSAVDKGAKMLAGGKIIPGPGYYYEPTVLLIEEGKEIRFDEEIFGPVCPIFIVGDDEEALSKANDSKYGLGATIWTGDPNHGLTLASRIEAGVVWINECGRALTGGDYFQGWKDSGIASSSDRLSLFMKKRAIIHHRSCKPRDGWMK